MTVLHLARKATSQVDLARATYHALLIAEIDDPLLAANAEHQEALTEARERYLHALEQAVEIQ
jgi:hypothetical protein